MRPPMCQLQVYSDMMYNLIKTSDRRNDSLSVEHEEQQQEVMNLDTKLMTFQVLHACNAFFGILTCFRFQRSGLT